MPTCRNCGNPTSFVVTLAVSTTCTESAYEPPSINVDLQCARCDSTAVDGDPRELLDPLVTATD